LNVRKALYYHVKEMIEADKEFYYALIKGLK